MRAGGRSGGSRIRELRVGAALLFLYGLALAGSDPEWATWAGAMSAGVLLMEAGPPMPLAASELFAGTGTLAVLGLLAFAALPACLGEDVCGRLAALWQRASGRWGHGGVPGKP